MVDLFEQAGYQISDTLLVPGPGYEEWERSGRRGEVRVGRLHIADTTPADAEEFFVYQYLIVARPNVAQTNGSAATNGSKCLDDRVEASISPRAETHQAQ